MGKGDLSTGIWKEAGARDEVGLVGGIYGVDGDAVLISLV